MSEALTCGEALTQLLEDYGVDLVFGIPGVHTLSLYKGLPRTKIRHVLARHEQGAAFMADGYARASGKPGCCLLITGPGVTNASTAIGQAYSDSIPMLVISSVNERWSLGRGFGRLHEMQDQRALTAPITAFSATALTPMEIPVLLAKAFAVFNSARPRPVHIEIPIDVLDEPASGSWKAQVPSSKPAPDPERAAEAAALLAKAKTPTIIAGGGAIAAGEAVRRLAERVGALVLTTATAKGILPPDHPLLAGSALSVSAGRDLVAESDCALVVGSELAETDLWSEELPFGGPMIRMDIDPEKLSDLFVPDLAICCDARLGLEAIAEALGEGAPAAAWPADRCAALRTAIVAKRDPLKQKHDAVLAIIAKHLPDDGLLSTDMTQIAYSALVTYRTGAARGFLHPVGYGTLGYGLPSAIGAKLATPERRVAALIGDGGFLYTVQELATAVEEGIDLVVLLWDNDSLAQIRDGMIERGIQQIGVNPRNPDFVALAKAFGAKVLEPQSLDDLDEALGQAFAAKGTTLVRIHESRISST